MYTPEECIDRLTNLGYNKAEIARRVGSDRVTITRVSQGGHRVDYRLVDALRKLLQAREKEVRECLRVGEGHDI